MFNFGEVAHHRRDHTVDGLLQLAVVDVDVKPNVQGLDAGVVLQAVLDELVYLGCTQPREPRDLMDHHKIERSGFDLIEEFVVDLTAAGVGRAADHLGVLNDIVDALALQVLTRLGELPLDVLVRCRHSRVHGCSRRVFGHVLAFGCSI